MVNPLVARATNDLLVGPDWAKNAEICDTLIHDPGQVKDVVKGIRRRIGSKNPKVQILALTLLETLMNNCGDFVHMHVAERGVLRKMMKIAKKKRNYHVKEKVLLLLDNWQEAFGGPGSRHPQYHAAFNTLLHAGVIFPRRSDRRAPVFSPLQNQPYPPYLHSPDHKQDTVSEEPEFPTLSLSEIQNARGIVDVLAEMLNGLEPGNEESLRQDSTIELVQQCRTYKQRVVHLINSTSDESLLTQGLALNDDLQRLLAKHEAIASGGNSGELVPKPPQALIDIGDLVATDEDQNKQPDEKTSSSDPANQPFIDLLLPEPSPSDVTPTPSTKLETGIDLLSWDDITAEDSLALVPVAESQENNPNNVAVHSSDPQSAYPNGVQYEQNLQGPHAGIYSGGSASNMDLVQYQLQQQPNEHLVNGSEGSNFPPPPWETQSANNQQPMHPHYTHTMQITQVGATHPHPMDNNMIYSHQITTVQGSAMMGMVPHGEQAYYHQTLQNNQFQGYGSQPQNNQFQGYGSQPQNNQFEGYGSQPQYLDQRMYALTMAASNTQYQASSPSNMQPSMRPKPEDKLFGDLVNMAKVKPNSSSTDTSASA